MQPVRLLYRQGIIANHLNLRVQGANQLVQVVGKAVVVVNQQNHSSTSSALFKALTTAAALLRHS